MKLYTEEEIVNFLKKEFADEINAETFMENLTPIEIPSTEIEYLSNHPEVLALDYIDGFMDGAWWVKDKIQGGEQ